MKKILVAATEDSRARVRYTLDGHFDYAFVTTTAEAHAVLGEGVDLVLCALGFDESGMFDLLRRIRSNPKTSAIPFFCIRTTDDALSPVLMQSVEIASSALGASAFIDLYSWRSQLGNETALRKLRDLLKLEAAHPDAQI